MWLAVRGSNRCWTSHFAEEIPDAELCVIEVKCCEDWRLAVVFGCDSGGKNCAEEVVAGVVVSVHTLKESTFKI